MPGRTERFLWRLQRLYREAQALLGESAALNLGALDDNAQIWLHTLASPMAPE